MKILKSVRSAVTCFTLIFISACTGSGGESNGTGISVPPPIGFGTSGIPTDVPVTRLSSVLGEMTSQPVEVMLDSYQFQCNEDGKHEKNGIFGCLIIKTPSDDEAVPRDSYFVSMDNRQESVSLPDCSFWTESPQLNLINYECSSEWMLRYSGNILLKKIQMSYDEGNTVYSISF